MGAVVVVAGLYFGYCLIKSKKTKTAAIREFENLPVGNETSSEK
jgi:hypothetical protein